MFQRVITCVAAFWMQRNITLGTEKYRFFLDICFSFPTCHVALRIINYHTYTTSHIKDLYRLQPEAAHSPSKHKDKHGLIISQCKHRVWMGKRQLDILKLLYKFPANNERSRSWLKLKERDWKIRTTKVDAGDFKQELLNRLSSDMAVNVLSNLDCSQ